VVPKARPMPLQSLAQRTVSLLPHGIRRPLLKLARPCSPTISQRRPKSKRVVVDAFCVAGGWPSPRRFRRSWSRSSLGLASSTEALSRFARSVLLLAGPEGPAVCVLDSSLGVHQRSPLRQYRCRASTPGWAEARPSARRLPPSEHVPPLPFFPATAVYSARHPAGLLHPASGPGVRHVAGPLRARCPKALGRWLAFPDGAFTLRSFPLRSKSLRVTAFRSPLAVAPGVRSWVRPCCHVWPRVLLPLARPQGFAPLRSPLRPAGVATSELPDAPLGLVPGRFRCLFPPPLRRVAVGWSLRSRRTAGDWPWDPVASSPHPRVSRLGIRCLARSGAAAPKGCGPWCVRRSGGPRGVHPCRRLAGRPRAAARSAPRLVRARGSGRAAGRARGRAPEGAFPEGVAASPKRRASAFVPLCRAACVRLPPTRGSVALGRADGSECPVGPSPRFKLPKELFPWVGARWVSLPWLGVPGGSVAAVQAPERTLPVGRGPVGLSAVGRRPGGSFAAVRGARRRLSPWLGGPVGLSAVGRGPVGPSPRFKLPKELFPWVGARWVRRRWLGGPADPSAAVQAPERTFPVARGPVGSSAAVSGPGGSVASVQGSRRSLSPWVGARWVLPPWLGVRGSLSLGPGSDGSLRRGSGARWVLRRGSSSRRNSSRGSGPGGSVAGFRGPWIPPPRFKLPKELFPWLGGPWIPPPRFPGPVGPSPRFKLPKELFPWVGARWVLPPWLGGPVGSVPAGPGPGGSVASVQAPERTLPVGRGPVGPSPRFGFPGNPSPRLGRGSRARRARPPRPEAACRPSRGRGGASAFRLPRPLKGRFRGLGLGCLPRGEGGLTVARRLWLGCSEERLRCWHAVRVSGQCRHRSSSVCGASSPAALESPPTRGSAVASRAAPECSPPAPRRQSSRRRRSGVGARVPGFAGPGVSRRLAGAGAPEPRAEACGRLGFGTRGSFCRGP
jgi:hypothetical protein